MKLTQTQTVSKVQWEGDNQANSFVYVAQSSGRDIGGTESSSCDSRIPIYVICWEEDIKSSSNAEKSEVHRKNVSRYTEYTEVFYTDGSKTELDSVAEA